MSIGLKENQTLYGIHYAGNMGRIDSLGFMHAISSRFHTYPKMQILGGKIKGVKTKMHERRGTFPTIQPKTTKAGDGLKALKALIQQKEEGTKKRERA